VRSRLVRPVLVAATVAATALALTPAGAAPAAPQVVDPAGDANFTPTAVEGGEATPVGNQAYADVLSVTWEPTTVTKVVKKKKVTTVTGFTVKTVLSAAPTPAAGTNLVYRMLGHPGDETTFLGPVYYTDKSSDPSIPQSALRDNLTGVTRLTPIDLPKIDGATITWTVPMSAVPKELKPGSTLTGLFFEVNEIEDFQGAQIPAGVPTFGGAYGLGTGQVDDGVSEATFKVG
jgi:hypothetical protein